jgi:hypothetical protein
MALRHQPGSENMAKFVPFKIDQSMTIYVNMDQVRAIWPSNLGSVLHFDKETLFRL